LSVPSGKLTDIFLRPIQPQPKRRKYGDGGNLFADARSGGRMRNSCARCAPERAQTGARPVYNFKDTPL
jgi:hypothetical protein